MKKERWFELEILDLPAGELEYFDRKSGALFADEGGVRETLGKALSAFANSGGGNIVLGVANDGQIDGVPKSHKGRQRTREWLEQVIPQLVAVPLQDFRVHEVEPANPSQIPRDKVVIVIDVGDSMLAPHQDIKTKHYFHRVGSSSQPAPHHVLERLRDRKGYPTQKIAHAWLNFVISPFLMHLEMELVRLTNQRLCWERHTGRLDGINAFYLEEGRRPANQIQFLESYPEVQQKLEMHDKEFRELSYEVSDLARAIQSSDAFKATYSLSVSSDSLSTIRPPVPNQVIFNPFDQTLSSLFGSASEAQRLALLAQHVINRESDLTDDRMPSALWNIFKGDFMAVLAEPVVREQNTRVLDAVRKLLGTVEALISVLQNIRSELAQRYGEVWEDETLRLSTFDTPRLI